MLFLILLVIIGGVIFFLSQNGKKGGRSVTPPQSRPNTSTQPPLERGGEVWAEQEPQRRENVVPESLPLRAKDYFFSRSENAFFGLLEQALPNGYRVFPNVRLNDLFLITTRENGLKQSTLGRLRDKHVDFVIVALPDYRPVLCIELDGVSHNTPAQQYRDAVKDTAFRSGGLKLVRLRTEQKHSRESLRKLLAEHDVRERVVA